MEHLLKVSITEWCNVPVFVGKTECSPAKRTRSQSGARDRDAGRGDVGSPRATRRTAPEEATSPRPNPRTPRRALLGSATGTNAARGDVACPRRTPRKAPEVTTSPRRAPRTPPQALEGVTPTHGAQKDDTPSRRTPRRALEQSFTERAPSPSAQLPARIARVVLSEKCSNTENQIFPPGAISGNASGTRENALSSPHSKRPSRSGSIATPDTENTENLPSTTQENVLSPNSKRPSRSAAVRNPTENVEHVVNQPPTVLSTTKENVLSPNAKRVSRSAAKSAATEKTENVENLPPQLLGGGDNAQNSAHGVECVKVQDVASPNGKRGNKRTSAVGTDSGIGCVSDFVEKRTVKNMENCSTDACTPEKISRPTTRNSAKKTPASSQRKSSGRNSAVKGATPSAGKENLETGVRSPRNCDVSILSSKRALTFSPKAMTLTSLSSDPYHEAACRARALDFSSPSKRTSSGTSRSDVRVLLKDFVEASKDLEAPKPKHVTCVTRASPHKPQVCLESPAKRAIFGTSQKGRGSPSRAGLRSGNMTSSPFKTPTKRVLQVSAARGSLLSPKRSPGTGNDVRQSPRKNYGNPYSSPRMLLARQEGNVP